MLSASAETAPPVNEHVGDVCVPAPAPPRPKSLANEGVADVTVDVAAVDAGTGDGCPEDENDWAPEENAGGDGFRNAASASWVSGLNAFGAADRPRSASGPARRASRSAKVDRSEEGIPRDASGSRYDL